MEAHGSTQIISSRVPLSEMFGYATELRSRTQGRATYSMHFDRYEQAPQNVSEEVVARVQGLRDLEQSRRPSSGQRPGSADEDDMATAFSDKIRIRLKAYD